MFKVAVKSDTNGQYDFNNTDLVLTVIPSNNIPSVGDILELDINDEGYKRYLVREIKRVYASVMNSSRKLEEIKDAIHYIRNSENNKKDAFLLEDLDVDWLVKQAENSQKKVEEYIYVYVISE